MSSDDELQQQGRGASWMLDRKTSDIAIMSWLDDNQVLLASSVCGIEPHNICTGRTTESSRCKRERDAMARHLEVCEVQHVSLRLQDQKLR